MIDLNKLLNEVITEYGINEGYVVPEIVWSDEIFFSRFGEYQFWTNKIIISNLHKMNILFLIIACIFFQMAEQHKE